MKNNKTKKNNFKSSTEKFYKGYVYRYWISMNNIINLFITDCVLPHKIPTQIYSYTNNKRNRENIEAYAMSNIDCIIANNVK